MEPAIQVRTTNNSQERPANPSSLPTTQDLKYIYLVYTTAQFLHPILTPRPVPLQKKTVKTYLHADVTGEDGSNRSKHESAGGKRSLYPRVLAHAHKEEDDGSEQDNKDAADGVLRGQEGVRALADGLVNLAKKKKKPRQTVSMHQTQDKQTASFVGPAILLCTIL